MEVIRFETKCNVQPEQIRAFVESLITFLWEHTSSATKSICLTMLERTKIQISAEVHNRKRDCIDPDSHSTTEKKNVTSSQPMIVLNDENENASQPVN